MDQDAIEPPELTAVAPAPVLLDYAAARREFRWEEARAALSGLPAGGLNIAHEAVDRHAAGPRADRVAIRWLGRSAAPVELTYRQLAERTSRFANALRSLGLRPGDRVFALLPRLPELFIASLGALKAQAVFCPLFSAFGPEPVQARLALGAGRVLVTTPSLYRRKVEGIRPRLPALEHVLLVGAAGGTQLPPGARSGSAGGTQLPPGTRSGAAGGTQLPPGTRDFSALLDAAAPAFAIPSTDPELPALLHFTSGTTGRPKGALHVHGAVVAHHATGGMVLDLHEDDVFWCTADPGWVTGTSYGIIAPLTHGATLVVDEADFDGERWYRILEQERVTVWYTAPTALRMLMRLGDELPRGFDLGRLRFIASVGEALNPEVVVWGQRALGLPVHDNWWQTETGGIMIANFRAMTIKPGSMGRPVPGVEAAIVRRSGDTVEELEDGRTGELALRPGWPSMFRGYLNEDARYRACFAGGFYLTGDLARRDGDGYFWFVGRADDMIKSSGHLVGPFEVESALLAHPAVAEAAAIGKPDPVAGELVKAFVSLRPGQVAGPALERELLAFARRRLGAVVAPKELAFLAALPRTRSGKILRRLLRARELGLPEGDTSTLEAG